MLNIYKYVEKNILNNYKKEVENTGHQNGSGKQETENKRKRKIPANQNGQRPQATKKKAVDQDDKAQAPSVQIDDVETIPDEAAEEFFEED